VGGGRFHDNTAERAGRTTRATGPSSPSDTAKENEPAVRLVGQPAGKTEKEAGEISPVAHELGFGAESERAGSRGRHLRSSISG